MGEARRRGTPQQRLQASRSRSHATMQPIVERILRNAGHDFSCFVLGDMRMNFLRHLDMSRIDMTSEIDEAIRYDAWLAAHSALEHCESRHRDLTIFLETRDNNGLTWLFDLLSVEFGPPMTPRAPPRLNVTTYHLRPFITAVA